MSEFIAGPLFFEVEQKEPGRVYNRYRIGNIVEGNLLLDRFELGFLLLNAKSIFTRMSAAERLDNLSSLLSEEGDIEKLLVFSHFKTKGMVCKLEKDVLKLRHKDEHSWTMKVVVRNENGFFNPGMQQDDGTHYSILDSDGDITFYLVQAVDPVGKSQKGSEEPRTRFGFLDLSVTEGNEYGIKRKIGHEIMIAPEQNDTTSYGNNTEISPLKRKVYADLVSRNLIIRTGFKYGADFRLYTESLEGHAEYLLLVSEKDTLRWYDISRAARIASSVHKEFIIASDNKGKIEYFSISRLKDVLTQI